MNKVVLIGNLTKDPELTVTTSGISICKMSLAVNRSFINADGQRETDYFTIVAWRNLADNCDKYLSKGKKAAVAGRLQTRSYEDKDGVKRYVTEIMAEDVEFLTPRGDDDSAVPATPKAAGKKKSLSDLEPLTGEDLPF